MDYKTLLIVLLCVIAGGASGYLLYRDFNADGVGANGKVMATLVRREAKVRRKPASSYLWQNVRLNDGLFLKESIQTGSGSAAVIRLNDGSLLELGENSLVVIDDQANIAQNFLKGSMVIRGAHGDRQITVDKDGTAKIENLPVRLLEPESLAEVFISEKSSKAVHFKWQLSEIANVQNALFLEISRDQQFKSGGTERIVISNGVISFQKVFDSKHQGQYFWRIVGKEGPLSQMRQFRIYPAVALKPMFPGAAESVRGFGENASVQFRWSAPSLEASSPSHELQVATDKGFKNIVAKQAIASGAGMAVVRKLPTGNLHWRIASRYGDLNLTSGSETFTYAQTRKVVIDLGRPSDGESVGTENPVRFSWNCDAAELDYLWELQASDGERIAQSVSPVFSAVWKPITGAYRWRVSARYKESTVAETTWRWIGVAPGGPIALVAPVKDQKLFFWNKPIELSFQWKTDPLVEGAGLSYEVEVGTDPNLSTKLFTERTQINHWNPSDLRADLRARLKSQTSTYFWRIKLVDASGHALKSSATQAFEYGVFPVLKPPLEPFPSVGMSFNVRDDERKPEIRWAPIRDAQSYEVTVLTDIKKSSRSPAQATRVILKKVVTGSQVDIGHLGAGKYRWSVRAIDPISRFGEALPFTDFEINYGKPLSAPKILTPEVQ